MSLFPKRIQLSRRKGWRLPPDSVNVARPTKWGNPFIIGTHGTHDECIELYRRLIDGKKVAAGDTAVLHAARAQVSAHIQELRGCNLACWCALDATCHADILLELANKG